MAKRIKIVIIIVLGFFQNKNASQQNFEGLGWLGNDVTTKKLPILNILVLYRNVPPTVVSIVDCTSHRNVGRKKYAAYI